MALVMQQQQFRPPASSLLFLWVILLPDVILHIMAYIHVGYILAWNLKERAEKTHAQSSNIHMELFSFGKIDKGIPTTSGVIRYFRPTAKQPKNMMPGRRPPKVKNTHVNDYLHHALFATKGQKGWHSLWKWIFFWLSCHHSFLPVFL